MADLRVSSPYLDVLEAQRGALVRALEPVVTDADIDQAHRESARLSVRLDASPLEDATADAVDRGDLAAPTHPSSTRDDGGWAAALRLDGLPTQEIAAIEYRGVRAAQAHEPALAEAFFSTPVETLVRAQRAIASGLLAAERLGALRRTSRAVHDGAQGQVIFHAPPPERLPDLLVGLDTWVRAARTRHRPLAVAGVVHARLLQWRPFEAGNGRVARIASRVALRATGGDPWGLAVPEREYAKDPLRYAMEVAATIRRGGDLRPWNQVTGEAIVAGLERWARRHDVVPAGVDGRAKEVCEALDSGDTITVRDLGAAAGLGTDAAVVHANLLCWVGLLRRDSGTQGLRYVRRADDVSVRAGSDPPK